MADSYSASAKRPFGKKLVCQLSGVPRSTFYYRSVVTPEKSKQRPGPKVTMTDSEVLEKIRDLLKERPFLGEGHRKLHVALRLESCFVGRDRLLRILRENGLLSPQRKGSCPGPRNHDGSITTEKPNEIWGTDPTFTMTEEDGAVAVFVAVEHFNSECMGIHASTRANRFEAMEPLRQGIKSRFCKYEKNSGLGLKIRHDNGSQYISRYFQSELRFLGVESSPSFVRSPEGNGVAERFIKTLKEQLLWVRRFKNVEELRQELLNFKKVYNEKWMVQKYGHQSPKQIYENYQATEKAA